MMIHLLLWLVYLQSVLGLQEGVANDLGKIKYSTSTTEKDLIALISLVEQNLPKGKECEDYKFPTDARLSSFVKLPYTSFLSPSLYPHAVLVHTVCFTHHSLGNDFGFYVETMLCAKEVGVHYAAPVFVDPLGGATMFEPFIKHLPRYALHSHPNVDNLAERVVGNGQVSTNMCITDMFPHEEEHALLHKNIPFARELFSGAMNAYFQSLKKADMTTESHSAELVYLAKDKVTVKNHDGSGGGGGNKNKIHLGEGGEGGGEGDLGNKQQQHELFPLVPDVAVHYRCGDNSRIAGLLPFRAIAALIPNTTDTESSASTRRRNIYILTEAQSSKTNVLQHRRCTGILHDLHAYLVSFFPSYNILLLRGQPLYVDMARLTYAPITICSASTFCLWPAISSNGTAHMPMSVVFKHGKQFDYGPNYKWISSPSVVYFNDKKCTDSEFQQARAEIEKN